MRKFLILLMQIFVVSNVSAVQTYTLAINNSSQETLKQEQIQYYQKKWIVKKNKF